MPDPAWLSLLCVAILGLLYPPILYPAVLWLLRVGRRSSGPTRVARPGDASGDRVGFSVIIPAHNEERVIRRKLVNTLHCARNAGAPFQVIVAADGCTDAT